jgi:hypothetical protein
MATKDTIECICREAVPAVLEARSGYGSELLLVTMGAQETGDFEERLGLRALGGYETVSVRVELTASLLLPPRDRPWQQAHRSDQRHRAAVPSQPGLSLLPRPAGLERLAADNSPRGAVVSLRPKPQEAPPPIPSQFALWFRRGVWLGADVATLSYTFVPVN